MNKEKAIKNVKDALCHLSKFGAAGTHGDLLLSEIKLSLNQALKELKEET